jgi:hypothetical protein
MYMCMGGVQLLWLGAFTPIAVHNALRRQQEHC